MPRPPRLVIPKVPLHITQRGVDRCPTFLVDQDFAFYRCALEQSAVEARCAVHAYVLMSNHVHLLVTPADTLGASRLVASLGRRYVRYFNDRYQRTGTLWEGRFRSTPVLSAPYLFTCSRYIELNPVRAGIVADPARYEWSSFRGNALGETDTVLTPHPLYVALDAVPESRRAAYRALFDTPLGPLAVAAVRASLHGRAKLHPTSYRQAIEAVGLWDTWHRLERRISEDRRDPQPPRPLQ